MEIDELGNELVNCNLHCPSTTREPERGIIPRTLIHEKRNGKNKIIVVGLNPGKTYKDEPIFYLDRRCSYQSLKDYFEQVLKSKPYFAKTRDLISCLNYDGDIFWTNLVKCECSGENGKLDSQTKRVCIKRFLRREIEIFDAKIIFALGNIAFDFCALSFPNHFVVGIPHPTGSHGDFPKLMDKIKTNCESYKQKLSNQKDDNGDYRAVKISKIEINQTK